MRILPGQSEVLRRGPLPAPERLVMTTEIIASYVVLLRLLHRRDLPSLVAAARRARLKAPPPTGGADEHRAALRLGWFVQRVVGWMPADRRCLIHSLVLLRVLARRSIDATLVIGVSRVDDFVAHAWIEHAGRPVLPSGEFERLLEL